MKNESKIRIMSGALAVLLLSNGYVLNKTANADAKYKRGTFIEETMQEDDYHYLAYVAKQGDNLSIISRKICKYFGVGATPIYWPVLEKMNGGTVVCPGDIIKFPCTIDEMKIKLAEIKGWTLETVNKKAKETVSAYKPSVPTIDTSVDGQMTLDDYVRKVYGTSNPEFVAVLLDYQGISGKYDEKSVITDKDNIKTPTTDQLLDFLTEQKKSMRK